ncbi:MAG TPA: hypothetical protein V6C72_03155, partial [Chroococcales cyanobacterium]
MTSQSSTPQGKPSDGGDAPTERGTNKKKTKGSMKRPLFDSSLLNDFDQMDVFGSESLFLSSESEAPSISFGSGSLPRNESPAQLDEPPSELVEPSASINEEAFDENQTYDLTDYTTDSGSDAPTEPSALDQPESPDVPETSSTYE